MGEFFDHTISGVRLSLCFPDFHVYLNFPKFNIPSLISLSIYLAKCLKMPTLLAEIFGSNT